MRYENVYDSYCRHKMTGRDSSGGTRTAQYPTMRFTYGGNEAWQSYWYDKD